jgi:hypothetical protein
MFSWQERRQDRAMSGNHLQSPAFRRQRVGELVPARTGKT